MKRIYILIVTILFCVCGSAQNRAGEISLFPIILNEDIPDEVNRNLSSTMSRIVTSYGFGSSLHAERFIISANVDIISNNIAPTNPPTVSKKLRISFIIGDIVENKSFSSCSINLSGVGASDTKAFISAISKLSPLNPEIKSMITQSKSKIVDYYGQSSKSFIAKAKAMVMKGNDNEAIAYLMSIPPVNDMCFEECQKYAIDIYESS